MDGGPASVTDVALATSAAPTYLPAHRLRGMRLVDGGVWANNPAIVAISEAVSEFHVDLADIRVLSLGTTTDIGVRPKRLNWGGLLPWSTEATSVFLRGQSLAAANATYHLLPRGKSIRIDPPGPRQAAPPRPRLPDSKQRHDLGRRRR